MTFPKIFKLFITRKKILKRFEQNKFVEDDLLWRILVNGDFEDYKLIRNKLSLKSKLAIECRSGFKPRKNMKELGEPIWKEYNSTKVTLNNIIFLIKI